MEFIFDELKQYMITGKNCKKIIAGKKYLIVTYALSSHIYSLNIMGKFICDDTNTYTFYGIDENRKCVIEKNLILREFYELENSFDKNRMDEIYKFIINETTFKYPLSFIVKNDIITLKLLNESGYDLGFLFDLVIIH